MAAAVRSACGVFSCEVTTVDYPGRWITMPPVGTRSELSRMPAGVTGAIGHGVTSALTAALGMKNLRNTIPGRQPDFCVTVGLVAVLISVDVFGA
ncbi:hypothetical protein [Actinoplanes philippinensis]|uniref:hypothetical protein n=1 Tax=Actinoplanes philippinensis TaxID=35752 RepID=UPI0033E6508C